MEHLFSYGTLQLDTVQRALFGRTLEGRPDRLIGYRVAALAMRDPAAVAASGVEQHFTLVPDPAAPALDGMLYALTTEEIAAADRYEGADYVRVAATFASGASGWVYVAA